MSNTKSRLKKWYHEYPFRFQWHDTDVSLVDQYPENPDPLLSPLTSLTLNVLTNLKTYNNLIICVPSMILRPIPLISYILANQTNRSVLVYSRNQGHYKNYYTLKVRYPRNFAYNTFPAGKIEKGNINIDLYSTGAKRSYREWFRTNKAPELQRKFLDEKYPKILFNLSKNIRFTDSIKNLSLDKERLNITHDIKLGIANLIFENLDYYIYNSFKFESFLKWVQEFQDEKHRFVFHVTNPNYSLLNDLKTTFNAYMLYFPFSFIKTNEDLNQRNKVYYKKIGESKDGNILNLLNLDNYEIYTLTKQDNFIIERPLRKGNVDRYFYRGMKLFEQVNWKNVDPEISPIIFQLKRLYFSIYKMFCIPKEFKIKLYDDELGWRSFYLENYMIIASRLVKKHSTPPTSAVLQSIITYVFKMASELSECSRYLEPHSYSRKGKNYALCDYLNANQEKKMVIGVQTGEKQLIYDIVDNYLSDGRIQVATFRQLAKSIKDFSEYTLLLAGHLLPSHFQILFKNWNDIRFFVYKGKNLKWVKDQIKLINQIDVSKEELSFKYLAEIYRNVIGMPDYVIQNDPLFKNFLEKKKRIVHSQDVDDETQTDGLKNTTSEKNLFEIDVKITSSSIMEIGRSIMKSNPSYKDALNEERAKSIVKRYNRKNDQKYLENIEHFDCAVILRNESSGGLLSLELDVRKNYLYFKNRDNIKIETGFPHSLRKDYYLILFGEKEKLSISDFVKDAFELEEDIDYGLINEWKGRLATFYLKNFNNYREFHKKFINSTPSTITGPQFSNWVKGNTNYTKDPMNLYYLGEIMEDDFFMENYKLIHTEGIKIQSFNQKLSKRIKKLVIQVLDGNISRMDCSPDELLLLENIENCIFKINEIQIKK
ncbi:MAG: hypothetical protein ACFFFT_00140 [Candidatus Thorarchaeota archaeon]